MNSREEFRGYLDRAIGFGKLGKWDVYDSNIRVAERILQELLDRAGKFEREMVGTWREDLTKTLALANQYKTEQAEVNRQDEK